jgi:hypothetical protein
VTETFFDQPVGRGGVPRDDHGNALILPRDATTDRLVPYTPASALADYISDDQHIHRWQMRNLAKAMGQNPDLCELAASEPYSTGLSNPTVGREKSRSGRVLDRIIERALDRVGIDEKADYGTAVHAWTEPGNGQPISARARADVESFHQCVRDHGIQIVATEIFTANDALKAAGTFDHLCWVPGYGYVICDKKTGKMDFYHFGVQLSTYSFGEVYDPATRKRRDLEELLPTGGVLNREVGIIFAIKDGRTTLHEVDLQRGLDGAEAAARARDYHEQGGMGGNADAVVSQHAKRERRALAEEARACQTRDQLVALRTAKRHLWTEDHDRIAQEVLSR